MIPALPPARARFDSRPQRQPLIRLHLHCRAVVDLPLMPHSGRLRRMTLPLHYLMRLKAMMELLL